MFFFLVNYYCYVHLWKHNAYRKEMLLGKWSEDPKRAHVYVWIQTTLKPTRLKAHYWWWSTSFFLVNRWWTSFATSGAKNMNDQKGTNCFSFVWKIDLDHQSYAWSRGFGLVRNKKEQLRMRFLCNPTLNANGSRRNDRVLGNDNPNVPSGFTISLVVPFDENTYYFTSMLP